MPMVARKFGAAAKTTSVEQGIGGGAPSAPAPYVAIASFAFDSVPAFQAAFAPHAPEIMADTPKYTSIQPVIQIREIKSGAQHKKRRTGRRTARRLCADGRPRLFLVRPARGRGSLRALSELA